jgi:hypothetical protein
MQTELQAEKAKKSALAELRYQWRLYKRATITDPGFIDLCLAPCENRCGVLRGLRIRELPGREDGRPRSRGEVHHRMQTRDQGPQEQGSVMSEAEGAQMIPALLRREAGPELRCAEFGAPADPNARPGPAGHRAAKRSMGTWRNSSANRARLVSGSATYLLAVVLDAPQVRAFRHAAP